MADTSRSTSLLPALAHEQAHIRQASRLGERIATSLYYALLVCLAVIFTFPLFWTLSLSLKTTSETFEFPPPLFPAVPQWINYVYVFTQAPFFRWILNSVLVVGLGMLGTLISASLVAYSFARFRYRGREVLFIITLGTLMLPPQITLIPQFILFNKMGWYNTLYPLWVPAWFGGGAFFIFLLRQFILSLPTDLDEAAVIDGAGWFRIFWTILMPLCKPALATMAIISFIGRWNDFLTPLIYLNSSKNFTVALGLSLFQNFPQQSDIPMQNVLMAASIITIVPPVALFFFAQRQFIQGVVLSGVKL